MIRLTRVENNELKAELDELTTEHPFSEILERVDEQLNQDDPEAIVHTVPLPAEVDRFCGAIDRNFNVTIELLDQISDGLLNAAAELQARANKLRNAKPEVSDHLREWIRYERESFGRGSFFKSLFK